MCISTFDEFINQNTFFLSPIILKKYLFDTKFDTTLEIPEQNINDYKEFIISLIQVNNHKELYSLLIEKEHWLDRVIKFTIASYESLGRLFLYLTKKYDDNKILNDSLRDKINMCKGRASKLPSDSQSIKSKFTQCRELIAYIISLMYFEELSNFFRNNIENGDIFDSILDELKIRYEEPCKGFRKLLELAENLLENDIYLNDLATYLYHSYSLVSKGETKAFEGYSYEKILLDYLHKNGITAEGTLSLESNNKETIEKNQDLCRNWDIYIPNKNNPTTVIEIMYNVTTSSGMTNKVDKIKDCAKKYPNLKIFVLMDGAGWIARSSDAKKLINDNKICVFTFNKNSLNEVVNLLC